LGCELGCDAMDFSPADGEQGGHQDSHIQMSQCIL
jgi:hypothetical protein